MRSAASRAALLVIAKSPTPGRVKTRLIPPLDADQACEVAWACLLDTLDVAARISAPRHVLVLDGAAGPWIPAGFDVVTQRGDGLGERLAAAFADTFASGTCPAALVIAMDTPHVCAGTVEAALDALDGGAASVLGPALDGGFWAIGLQRGYDPAAVFDGIPMSPPRTGAAQRARLAALGLDPVLLPTLRDLDDMEDLVAIAAAGPPRLAALARLFRSHSTAMEVS
ncbi:MAG: glycosyltransferase [Acidimicrobiales bacterium]|nr:glycosyltransferase [Acidimicrobiales bacterium]